ncbi:DnaJ C-terminal domain-containing protein [Mycoplasma sp. Mirounga ES2805-ORL]|uniref:DnaJ C-terminal domain-containing protein n=1 Tax=Mycoplasma sp. Mirounga ES2805-ORL TaxID=754514 RepID=UPI001F120F7F|nr:DnaJ C-terminal domain-containing protein [Mycoplasma sp. Mirounga ES2805-ORL]
MSKNYYQVLGVNKNATEKEIKSAYRKLAMKYHPDKLKDGTSDQKMAELNEAYEVLMDPKKKSNYDRYGSPDGPQGYPGGAGPTSRQRSGGMDVNMGGFSNFAEDIFNSFFGNFTSGRKSSSSQQRRSSTNSTSSGARRAPAHEKVRGEDTAKKISISFADAIKGTKIKEELPKWELCSKCKATGANSPRDIATCPTCRGTGSVAKTLQTPFGYQKTISTCSNCSGSGRVILKPCTICKGTTYTKKTKKVTINIPEGTDDGDKIKLTGFGEKGQYGGESGDMYVVISVKSHKYFKRNGLDVLFDFPVSFLDIIKENTVIVQTPYNSSKIKLKSSYQTGKVLNLSGKGVKSSKGTGNLKITLRVVMPSFSQKEFEEMAELLEPYEDTINKELVEEVKKSSNE